MISRSSPPVSLLSLPLHVKMVLIEHCYILNDQRVVAATGSLRATCKSLLHLTLSHPLWKNITQYTTNCELCELKKARPLIKPAKRAKDNNNNEEEHFGTSIHDPDFHGKLYLNHMSLLKAKNSYANYLKYYQFEEGIPNIFHIHRVCGGLSELDTIMCLIDQEMQFGDNREFRVAVLVDTESFTKVTESISALTGSQFKWKQHTFRYPKYHWPNTPTSQLVTFIVEKHQHIQFFGQQFKNLYIGVGVTTTVESLDQLAVDVLFTIGIEPVKELYKNSKLFDRYGSPSELITLQPYFKIISIV